MILILLSWLLMLCVCYPLGFAINKYLQLHVNTSLILILGIILLVNLANLFSFFLPLDQLFLESVILLSTLITVIYKTELITKIKFDVKSILNTKNSFIIGLSALLYAAYSSAFSSINDDGLYYIQTTLWLKKYGLVHGLSNLHVSLGLCSSWHVFQTVFSFTEKMNFNDVNGFLMLIFTFYLIENTIAKKSNIVFYVQFLLTLIISLPFYSSPNPDLAVIVFTILGIHLFTQEPKKNYAILLLIASFALTIKISALVLFVLGIYLTFKNYRTISYKLFVSILLIGGIHISKNVYQTAYPLYPLKTLSIKLDWKTPEPIIDYYLNGIKTWAYSKEFKPKEIDSVKDKSHFEILKLLLSREGSKGLINKVIFTAFLLSVVLLIFNLKNKKIINVELHIILGISIFIWFMFSPQYRFAIPMLITWLVPPLLAVALAVTKNEFVNAPLYVNLFVVCVNFELVPDIVFPSALIKTFVFGTPIAVSLVLFSIYIKPLVEVFDITTQFTNNALLSVYGTPLV